MVQQSGRAQISPLIVPRSKTECVITFGLDSKYIFKWLAPVSQNIVLYPFLTSFS